ncbi:hypothetical protein ElyMa_001298500 [Elysia marginata]|uniref:Uncharacterized protein n=1 Tax=Elysia marginata TaxID=1093978 RepID=A0AAV4IKR6_9GAST|nr:hypothetical protein ElyMa_001298500 [Elysia marginata]
MTGRSKKKQYLTTRLKKKARNTVSYVNKAPPTRDQGLGSGFLPLTPLILLSGITPGPARASIYTQGTENMPEALSVFLSRSVPLARTPNQSGLTPILFAICTASFHISRQTRPHNKIPNRLRGIPSRELKLIKFTP